MSNFIDARNISWDDILPNIDMLLYDDNSLCIEALKYNMLVVYFGLTGQVYNTDRLYKYDREKIIVDSVEKFKKYLTEYYKNEYSLEDFKEREAYNKAYLQRYFSPISEENLSFYL